MPSVRTAALATALAGAVVASNAADGPLGLGETRSFRLEQNARTSYSATLPAGPFLIVLDSRRADGRHGSLRSELTVRNQQGTVVHQANLANAAGIEHRAVSRINLTSAGTLNIDIRNVDEAANYWLTIIPARGLSAAPPSRLAVPLFGAGQPITVDPRARQAGRLDKGEHAYFSMALSAGVYDAALEFTNPNGFVTALAGSLTLLDGDGETLQTIVQLDAMAVSVRENGIVSIPQRGVFLFKVYNQGGPLDGYYRTDFTLTLSPR